MMLGFCTKGHRISSKGVTCKIEDHSVKLAGVGVSGEGVKAETRKQNRSSVPQPTRIPTRGKVGGPLAGGAEFMGPPPSLIILPSKGSEHEQPPPEAIEFHDKLQAMLRL